MTSQDQFETWASEHLPTLYLTKTDHGTYESTATGNFFAVWSARDGVIAQLKATVADYEMGLEAAKEEIARLKGENEGLRKDAERYRYMRKCSCEFRSRLPYHGPVLESEYDAECDAGMSKGEQP